MGLAWFPRRQRENYFLTPILSPRKLHPARFTTALKHSSSWPPKENTMRKRWSRRVALMPATFHSSPVVRKRRKLSASCRIKVLLQKCWAESKHPLGCRSERLRRRRLRLALLRKSFRRKKAVL